MPSIEAENILRLCSNLYFHFYFGLFHILIGLVALILRCLPLRFRKFHKYAGQGFLYATIIQITTSLYVRNDGFRWFIFVFLMICILNLIVGHMSIRIYQQRVADMKIQQLEQKLLQKQQQQQKQQVELEPEQALPTTKENNDNLQEETRKDRSSG